MQTKKNTKEGGIRKDGRKTGTEEQMKKRTNYHNSKPFIANKLTKLSSFCITLIKRFLENKSSSMGKAQSQFSFQL